MVVHVRVHVYYVYVLYTLTSSHRQKTKLTNDADITLIVF